MKKEKAGSLITAGKERAPDFMQAQKNVSCKYQHF